MSDVQTDCIGGGVSKLASVEPQIQRKRDEGRCIAVVLDADSDAGSRRAEFFERKQVLDLPVDRLFLLPNDRNPGSLETVLEQVAVHPHVAVYNCLDEYRRCLRKHDGYGGPSPKGRIYAYCEALGIETHAARRDYSDPSCWDLGTPALEPLKQFLVGLQVAKEGT